MPRYSHYLYPAKPGRWPQQVVCLSVTGKANAEQSSGNRMVQELDSWHAVCLSYKDHSYGTQRIASGREQSAFWDSLNSMLQSGREVWIVSSRADKDWSLLGVWSLLETGRLALIGPDTMQLANDRNAMRSLRQSQSDPLGAISEGKLQSMRRRFSGYLVCENPPNVLRARLDGSPGWIRWVDTRNFGVDMGHCSPVGQSQAHAIEQWWTESSHALREYGIGPWANTVGSMAMLGWRRSYHTGGIQAHCRKHVLAFEGAGYYGGRCEAYRLGKLPGQWWHYDFRSLYPSVCARYDIPARLVEWHPDAGKPVDIDWNRPLEYAALVTLETDTPDYPHRGQHNTTWPIGRFKTVLCGPELQDAHWQKKIVRVHAAAKYALLPWLKTYSERIYELRCEAEKYGCKGLQQLAKRLLVCLPGKLGQLEREWEIVRNGMPLVMWGEWYGSDRTNNPCRYRSLGGIVQRNVVRGYAADSVPAAAGWITSHGRMCLLHAIRVAGRENVAYVDTDSIVVNNTGAYRLAWGGIARNRELGYLELKAGPVEMEVLGIKWYVENGKLVCAGMPAGTTQLCPDGQHYWHDSSPREQIQTGDKPEARSVLRPFSRANRYAHGNVADDGTVTPLQLWEE